MSYTRRMPETKTAIATLPKGKKATIRVSYIRDRWVPLGVADAAMFRRAMKVVLEDGTVLKSRNEPAR